LKIGFWNVQHLTDRTMEKQKLVMLLKEHCDKLLLCEVKTSSKVAEKELVHSRGRQGHALGYGIVSDFYYEETITTFRTSLSSSKRLMSLKIGKYQGWGNRYPQKHDHGHLVIYEWHAPAESNNHTMVGPVLLAIAKENMGTNGAWTRRWILIGDLNIDPTTLEKKLLDNSNLQLGFANLYSKNVKRFQILKPDQPTHRSTNKQTSTLDFAITNCKKAKIEVGSAFYWRCSDHLPILVTVSDYSSVF
jgi:hypothetical protein